MDLVQLRDDRRAVALLDYFKAPPDQRDNLVAIDEHGTILWRSKLPTTHPTDAFTEMEVLDEGISAFSWSGHRVLIDPQTGVTLDDEFTK